MYAKFDEVFYRQMKEVRPTYRSEIDGLRAFAVVSVMLYHANISALGTDFFRGGYIGVDVFFCDQWVSDISDYSVRAWQPKAI